MEEVILVNEQDEETGTMEKMEAHRKGVLHRAVSVFIFNDAGELMLQQRDSKKYHSAGLWTNTCCGHPRPGEKEKEAAERRLLEEMGIKVSLEKKFHLLYKAELSNSLTEHEFDHVFFGTFNEVPLLNVQEASDWKWISIRELKEQIKNSPENFTTWFRLIIGKHF